MILAFLLEQWMLVSALLVLVALLIVHENKKSGSSVTPQVLAQMVNKQDAKVIDVREVAEYKQGHIVDALNIPYAKFAERKTELDKFKQQPIILVCKMGQSVSAAAKQLHQDGFAQVYRLNGGMMEWKASAMPIVKGKNK